MITIIHGSNQLATRNQLQLIKNKYKEIIVLDGKNLDQTNFYQSIESVSLFGEERLVIIENFFGTKTDKAWFSDYLEKNQVNVEIVFWEDKDSKSKEIKNLADKAKILNFNIPTLIFKFLDSLAPANSQYSLSLLEDIFKSEEPEIVFFMLVKQFRYLILAKENTNQVPSDFKRLAPWQIGKITRQASLFPAESMLKIYQELENLDYQIKNGLTAQSLDTLMKYLLIKYC